VTVEPDGCGKGRERRRRRYARLTTFGKKQEADD
jgi:hypothetical protein